MGIPGTNAIARTDVDRFRDVGRMQPPLLDTFLSNIHNARHLLDGCDENAVAETLIFASHFGERDWKFRVLEEAATFIHSADPIVSVKHQVRVKDVSRVYGTELPTVPLKSLVNPYSSEISTRSLHLPFGAEEDNVTEQDCERMNLVAHDTVGSGAGSPSDVRLCDQCPN